jgi:hypothetical protein
VVAAASMLYGTKSEVHAGTAWWASLSGNTALSSNHCSGSGDLGRDGRGAYVKSENKDVESEEAPSESTFSHAL